MAFSEIGGLNSMGYAAGLRDLKKIPDPFSCL